MTETIAAAVVDIARLAVIAYGVHFAGQAALIYVQRMPVQPTDSALVDEARRRGFEVQA